MRKLLSATVATMAIVSANAASAQTFTTTPGTYTFSGLAVDVQKGNGPQLTCSLSIDIVNSGGTITATNPSMTGGLLGLCASVVFQGAPWTVTNPSPNVWRVNGIYVDTTITPGDCQGHLDAVWSPGENLTLDTGFSTASTLPEVDAGTGHCKIRGVISWP
jgi:hypothetical protein